MKKYSKIMSILLVLAMLLPGFSQLATADAVNPEVIRIAGENRIQTAIKVSQKAYGNGKADTVVLAGYSGEADALTGTLLANHKKAPMLLTYKDKIDPNLLAEMTRLGTKKVYILGGETVVNASVQTALVAKGFTVKRLAGSTRVQTAVKIAEEVFGSNKPAEAFFVEYSALADALAIGPVAAMKNAPIFMTNKDSVPAETKAALAAMGIKKGTIIGGETALPNAGKAALEALGLTVGRVAGEDRVKTSLKIANTYFAKPDAVIIANGRTMADALVGGYFGAMMNAPVLLAEVNNIHADILAYIKAAHVDTYVLGGLAAINENVFNQIKAQMPVDKDLKVELVNVTTDEVKKESTLTAVVKNFKAGAKATITLTPDSKLGLKDIVVKDVAIDEKGNIKTILGELPVGTHSVVVSVGEVKSQAFVFTIKLAAEVPVPGTYKLVLDAADKSLVGDGKSNTTIHVTLVDVVTNEIAKANGLQVKLVTTYGTLSDQQITLQNGYGHTTLNSEAVQKAINVDLDAQIIEATVPVPYKDNISGMKAKLGLVFTTPAGAKLEDIPRLLKAESNQADRVTLWFDRNVDPAEFNNANSVATVKQAGKPARTVLGYHRLPGNDPKSLEVILAKDTPLTDNKTVEVGLALTRNGHTLTTPAVNFILTDNRKPQATEIKHDGNMRTITVYFSEAIESARFNLDGGTNVISNAVFGEFDPIKQVDNRHIATLTTRDYLKAGKHTLQVSSIKDFAYATDNETMGSTQEFTFEVKENKVRPTANVLVESPEQYRIFLDSATKLNGSLQDVRLEINISPYGTPEYHKQWKEVKIKVADPSTYPTETEVSGYNGIFDLNGNKKLAWVTQYGDFKELVMETNTDWTYVYNTIVSRKNYYNDDFRIVIPADTFRNKANGLGNETIILPLVLPIEDDSPKMVGTPVERDLDYGEHDITFNRPVKGFGLEENEVDTTPSQLQDGKSEKLPNIVVEYRGGYKNADGKRISVTEYGTATKYVSANGKDTEIRVRSNNSLRALVDNKCYEEDWTMIVRNVTDDTGNAAETINKNFTIKHKVPVRQEFKIANANVVEIKNYGNVNVNMPTNPGFHADKLYYDIVRVEYTDLIRLTGTDDSAINKSNYKLNNRDLGDDSFVLVDLSSKVDTTWDCLCRYDYEGYNAVYIFTPKDSTLNKDKWLTHYVGYDNTLEVNQRLMSAPLAWNPGMKLAAPYQVDLNYKLAGWEGLPVCRDQKPSVN